MMNAFPKNLNSYESTYKYFRTSFARIADDNSSGIILSGFLNVMSQVYNENEVSTIALTEIFNTLDEDQTGVLQIDIFLNPTNPAFAEHIRSIEQRFQASKMNDYKIAASKSTTYEYSENKEFDTAVDIKELVNQSSMEDLKNMVKKKINLKNLQI